MMGPGKISLKTSSKTTHTKKKLFQSKHIFLQTKTETKQQTEWTHVSQALLKNRSQCVPGRNCLNLKYFLLNDFARVVPSQSPNLSQLSTGNTQLNIKQPKQATLEAASRVVSHLPPSTYALSVHSFCELGSQRKTVTLSPSIAAAYSGYCFFVYFFVF